MTVSCVSVRGLLGELATRAWLLSSSANFGMSPSVSLLPKIDLQLPRLESEQGVQSGKTQRGERRGLVGKGEERNQKGGRTGDQAGRRRQGRGEWAGCTQATCNCAKSFQGENFHNSSSAEPSTAEVLILENVCYTRDLMERGEIVTRTGGE